MVKSEEKREAKEERGVWHRKGDIVERNSTRPADSTDEQKHETLALLESQAYEIIQRLKFSTEKGVPMYEPMDRAGLISSLREIEKIPLPLEDYYDRESNIYIEDFSLHLAFSNAFVPVQSLLKDLRLDNPLIPTWRRTKRGPSDKIYEGDRKRKIDHEAIRRANPRG